jgi:hypothetical protein
MSARRRKLVAAALAVCVIVLAVVVLRWPVGPRVLVVEAQPYVWRLERSARARGLWLPVRERSSKGVRVVEARRCMLGASLRTVAWVGGGIRAALSPDGSKLAVISTQADVLPQEIVVYTLPGGREIRRIQAPSPSGWAPRPEIDHLGWSPSGQTLAFSVSPRLIADDNETGVYTVGSDGQVKLWGAAAGRAGWIGGWSPTGERMAACCDRPRTGYGVAVFERDSGRVAEGPSGWQAKVHPVWHPSGDRLAVLMKEQGGAAMACWELDVGTGEGRILASGHLKPLAYTRQGNIVVAELAASGYLRALGLLDVETGTVRRLHRFRPGTGLFLRVVGLSPDRRHLATMTYLPIPDRCSVHLLDLDTFELKSLPCAGLSYPFDMCVLSAAGAR